MSNEPSYSPEAREAYLQHCASWGGFDSVDEARQWADRSIHFNEQVESHARLLDAFSASLRQRLEAAERVVNDARPTKMKPCGCCQMSAQIGGAFVHANWCALDAYDNLDQTGEDNG